MANSRPSWTNGITSSASISSTAHAVTQLAIRTSSDFRDVEPAALVGRAHDAVDNALDFPGFAEVRHELLAACERIDDGADLDCLDVVEAELMPRRRHEL